MTACELCDEETGGRYLCERHTVQLARRLDDLPILYDEVGASLARATAKVTKNPAGGGQGTVAQKATDDPWAGAQPANGQQQGGGWGSAPPAQQGAGYSENPPF